MTLILLLEKRLGHFVLSSDTLYHLLLRGNLKLCFTQLTLELVMFTVLLGQLSLKLLDSRPKFVDFGLISLQVWHELAVHSFQIDNLLLELCNTLLRLPL